MGGACGVLAPFVFAVKGRRVYGHPPALLGGCGRQVQVRHARALGHVVDRDLIFAREVEHLQGSTTRVR